MNRRLGAAVSLLALGFAMMFTTTPVVSASTTSTASNVTVFEQTPEDFTWTELGASIAGGAAGGAVAGGVGTALIGTPAATVGALAGGVAGAAGGLVGNVVQQLFPFSKVQSNASYPSNILD